MKPSSTKGLLELFRRLDTDGNGSISQSELQKELKLFGLSNEQIKSIQKKLDLNMDGEVTLDEYKIALGIPFEVSTITDLNTPRYRKQVETMKMFAELDVNRDGKISKDEFFRVMQTTNMTTGDIQKMFAKMDLTNDGVITIGEYKFASGIAEQDLQIWKNLFEELDRDHSGDITPKELITMFKEAQMPILREAVEEWIAEYDHNGDGKLNYQEFLSFVVRQAEKAFP